MNVNYRTLPTLLQQRRAFAHGSCHAVRSDNEYKVYSYQTLILTYDLLHGRTTYYNAEHYSRTTSRLQNILIRIFDTEKNEVCK